MHSYSYSSILHPTHPIHLFSPLLIHLSQLWVLYHICSDTRYHMFICCVDRKHSQSIRRICLCFWYMIREQWHRMIRKWENEYLETEWNRCSRSNLYRSWFHQMIIEGCLHQSITKTLLSRITEPIVKKLPSIPLNSVNDGRSIRSSAHSISLRIVNVFL